MQRAIKKGLVTTVTGLDRAGNKMGAAALNKTLTGATATGVVHTPATRKIIGEGGVKGIREAVNPARAVTTTDALARQPNIHDRLAAMKSQAANGRVVTKPTTSVFGNPIKGPTTPQTPAAPQGILGRAKALATNHPKLAIGAGLAGAYGAGRLASNANNNRSNAQYGNMPY